MAQAAQNYHENFGQPSAEGWWESLSWAFDHSTLGFVTLSRHEFADRVEEDAELINDVLELKLAFSPGADSFGGRCLGN